MTISNYLEDKLLNAVFYSTAFGLAANPYASLHTDNPGENGANEVSGGGYARVEADFFFASGGVTSNTWDLVFPNVPLCTVSWVGLWDAITGGNFLWYGPLDVPRSMPGGVAFMIQTGQLDITLD